MFVKISEHLSFLQIHSIQDLLKILHLAKISSENMILSLIEVQELKVFLNELEVYGLKNQDIKDNLSLRRLKSVLERGLRLANYFTN